MSRFKEYLEIAQNKLTIKTFEYDQHMIQLAIVDEKESEIIWEGKPFPRDDEALYQQELSSVQHRLDKIQQGKYVGEEAAAAGGSTISTANVQAPGAGQVGTIRKLKRDKKGNPIKYSYASGAPATITKKNPDGTYAKEIPVKGDKESHDYPDGILSLPGNPGGIVPMQKRSIPSMQRGKKK